MLNPLPAKSSIYFHMNCIMRMNSAIKKEMIYGERKLFTKYLSKIFKFLIDVK